MCMIPESKSKFYCLKFSTIKKRKQMSKWTIKISSYSQNPKRESTVIDLKINYLQSWVSFTTVINRSIRAPLFDMHCASTVQLRTTPLCFMPQVTRLRSCEVRDVVRVQTSLLSCSFASQTVCTLYTTIHSTP